MEIDDAKKTGETMLKLDPLLECADVIADVEAARGLHAGKDEVLHRMSRKYLMRAHVSRFMFPSSGEEGLGEEY